MARVGERGGERIAVMSAPVPEEQRTKRTSWLKRLGWAGFLFFLLKGLVWLAIFAGAGTLWAC
jgi:hypothetical protein